MAITFSSAVNERDSVLTLSNGNLTFTNTNSGTYREGVRVTGGPAGLKTQAQLTLNTNGNPTGGYIVFGVEDGRFVYAGAGTFPHFYDGTTYGGVALTSGVGESHVDVNGTNLGGASGGGDPQDGDIISLLIDQSAGTVSFYRTRASVTTFIYTASWTSSTGDYRLYAGTGSPGTVATLNAASGQARALDSGFVAYDSSGASTPIAITNAVKLGTSRSNSAGRPRSVAATIPIKGAIIKVASSVRAISARVALKPAITRAASRLRSIALILPLSRSLARVQAFARSVRALVPVTGVRQVGGASTASNIFAAALLGVSSSKVLAGVRSIGAAVPVAGLISRVVAGSSSIAAAVPILSAFASAKVKIVNIAASLPAWATASLQTARVRAVTAFLPVASSAGLSLAFLRTIHRKVDTSGQISAIKARLVGVSAGAMISAGQSRTVAVSRAVSALAPIGSSVSRLLSALRTIHRKVDTSGRVTTAQTRFSAISSAVLMNVSLARSMASQRLISGFVRIHHRSVRAFAFSRTVAAAILTGSTVVASQFIAALVTPLIRTARLSRIARYARLDSRRRGS